MNYKSFYSRILSVLLILVMFGCAGTMDTTKETKTPSVVKDAYVDLDTVTAKRFDTGKMWTFEHAPLDYFEKTYNFRPSETWLQQTQLSAIKFANWCSSSFVSADGLILTNHHCIDFIINRFQEQGEDIPENGFYAKTLEEERKVPGLSVTQLVLIKDVTDEVVAATDAASDDKQKVELRDRKIAELERAYSDESGLDCRVTILYHGGKFSMYCYKKYEDVRVVLINERAIGMYGGDPDNFTYPRYNADFAFLRAYGEDGKPLQTENFFKWNVDGPQAGEPLFVVGNPGSTQRLKTVAQLEYFRDYTYKNNDFLNGGMVDVLYNMMEMYPEQEKQINAQLLFLANSAKVYEGVLEGLRDPLFMARKKDFEDNFKSQIKGNPELSAKYGHVWDGIEGTRNELRKTAPEYYALTLSPRMQSEYFTMGADLYKLAKQLQLPEADREDAYKGSSLDATAAAIYKSQMDVKVQKMILALNSDFIAMNLPELHPLRTKMMGNMKGSVAAEGLLNKSVLTSAESVKEIAGKGAEAILASGDPFVEYAKYKDEHLDAIQKQRQEITETEEALENLLGRALYEVYGTSIPPDATFTLRISDGVMKKYEYNGTIAPTFTTFHGLYDRYYSHEKQLPWDLPERWVNYDADFDLGTQYNFISTNDIIGGNSGSPVINKNREVVGVAFDGNIESLPGNFIYTTEANRTVSVSSKGIYEIVKDLYKAERLARELQTGGIVD